MEHVSNIMDAVWGGIVLAVMAAVGNLLLKATKNTGVARTLIRFIWSSVLLTLCAFSALASYITYHGRGFNNGAFFILYLISSFGYGFIFALFNSNWIGSYADKASTTWKHFRNLASPDYTPQATSAVELPSVVQMVANLEEIDYRSEGLFKVTRQLKQVGAEAVEPLIVALSHNRVNVRQNAAYALGRIKDTRAIEPLIETFNKEGMSIVTAAALGNFGRPAVDPLAKAARDTNRKVRDGAISALGWCQDVRAVEELDKLFEEWLERRQSDGQELVKISDELLEEYWLLPLNDMPHAEWKELMDKRANAISALRRRAVDYHDLHKWWKGGTIAQALSSALISAIKQQTDKP